MKKLSALLLTAMAAGCAAQAALVRQHNPTSEVEAGAVTISASAPMRWEDVVGELRPEFNSVTARDYVNTAIATTQQDFSSRREATSVQLGVDVSGETTQRTQTTDTSASGQTTTTGREVVSQNPAAPLRRTDGGQIVDGSIAAPNNAFTGADRPAQWPAGAAGQDAVDPILRYRAAVALHQELVLLDNYLNSAYDPCLQEAWLVRTRLVATPYARNQPIDAYSRIYATYQRGRYGSFRSGSIRIVPLLVTDNFERSDARRYEQLAAQVQASLNGVSGVVAAGLGFNRYLNNLNAILGSQYNNLLTISQVDDYTLMVRLGAAFSPTSRYEMQSRSYDITFLVVIDKDEIRGNDPISLGFFAETEMRDAESGELLQVVTPTHQRELLRSLDAIEPNQPSYAAAWERAYSALDSGVTSETSMEDIQSLPLPADVGSRLAAWFRAAAGEEDYGLLAQLDYEETDALHYWSVWTKVRRAVETGQSRPVILDDVQSSVFPDELRSDLVRWYLASRGSTAVMPVRRGQVGLPEAQDGVFRDSLAGGLVARVVGPAGLNQNHLRAELLVGASGSDPALTFAANSITINPEGVVDAAFPSLGAIGVDADRRPIRLHLTRQCPTTPGLVTPSSLADEQPDPRDAAERVYTLFRDRAVLQSMPVQAVSFRADAVGGVAAIQPSGDRSIGDARIRLSGIDQRSNPYVAGYEIQVRGAFLTAADRFGDGAASLTVNGADNTVRVGREFGAYNLSLERLTPGTPVNVKVVGIGAHGDAVPGESVEFNFTVSQASGQ